MRDARGFGDREATIVDRAPDDDCGDAGIAQPHEILEATDATRRDHLAVDRACELCRDLDVRPDVQTVARDIGVEQRGGTPARGPLAELDRGDAPARGPAVDGD